MKRFVRNLTVSAVKQRQTQAVTEGLCSLRGASGQRALRKPNTLHKHQHGTQKAELSGCVHLGSTKEKIKEYELWRKKWSCQLLT